MSVLEVKNDLLRLIVETDDPDVLTSVRQYFKILKKEPVSEAEIAAQEARMVEMGIQQIDSGQVLTHEEARKKIDALLRKHTEQ